MNRRNFLAKSAAMSVALAGLPLAKKKKEQNVLAHYYVKMDYQYPGKSTILNSFKLSLYHDVISNFNNASAVDKIITLSCNYYGNTEKSKSLPAFEYKFDITTATKDKDDSNIWILKTTGAKKITGDVEWPDALPKNPTIKITRGVSVELLNAKGDKFVKMNYVSPTESDDDDMYCFITTACVTERKMADQCDELNTLRSLRENYMRNTLQGKELLKEYDVLGPSVVTAIAACENRSDIYDYLYQHMIMPSVAMIKKGNYQEAVDWYHGFTVKLKENYS